MNILEHIQRFIAPTPQQRFADRVKSKSKKVSGLKRETDNLTKKDVKAWFTAWQMALNYEEPKRTYLYDIYKQVLVDNHLSGCIDQRKDQTLRKDFKLSKDGKADDDAKRYFEAQWFFDFLGLALDAKYWGHSLIELGDVVGEGEGMRLNGVQLIPRKHVVPEYGVITMEPGGDVKDGVGYRDGDMADWLVEVGEATDLGLLLKAAPQSLSKKNMLAYWDMFGEIFGMPMRVATIESTLQDDWDKAADMMQNMGAAGWGLLPGGSELKIIESSRGDAYNVYDKRVDRCNGEVSKLILGQTMTIDSGSSLSQSEVHLEVFYNKCAGDATYVRNVINDQLIPLMVLHGFPLDGYVFDWDEKETYTVEEQQKIETLLLQNYEIDPQYFVEKYNIPITGSKSKVESSKNEDEGEKLVDGFFA